MNQNGQMNPQDIAAIRAYNQAKGKQADADWASQNFSASDPAIGPLMQNYANVQNANNQALFNATNPVYQSGINSMMDAYAKMYGSNQDYLGTLATAQGGVQQAGLGANASMHNSDNTLAGTKDTNQTNLGITGINADAFKYGSDNTLSGVQDTNQSNQNIANIGAHSAQEVANISTNPQNRQIDLLSQLLGGNGTGAGGGLGGALGGALGGGGAGSVVDGTTGTGTQAPPVPTFQNFNSILSGQRKGQQAAALTQQENSQKNQLQGNLGSRGFSSHSPGAQSMLMNMDRDLGSAITANNNNVDFAASQYNAQNALPYGQAGLSQYNADQDRAMRLRLAQIAGSQGLLQGLLV